jgi:hypothetical protein
MGVSFLCSMRLPRDYLLQALAPERFSFQIGVWLLGHPDFRNSERVKTFRVFVGDQLHVILEQ